MARSDLLLKLVQAGTRGDTALFRQVAEALMAEERAKQHHILADQLAESLRTPEGHASNGRRVLDEQVRQLAFEVIPRRTLGDLYLPEQVRLACNEVVEEHHRSELLQSYNLEPRHRILLTGPPGNGKTSLAEALAEALMLPLFAVRYEGVIGSYLGETAARLRLLFDYVRTRNCVLFFDEFDTLGKERGDIHETGEIKRVVSSLLLQIDTLPSYVIVVTATNHPELLDRAVWRRFQLRLLLPPPKRAQIEQWVRRFESRIGHNLGYPLRELVLKMQGMNFSDMEEFGADIQRRYILSLPDAVDLRVIVGERLKQWQTRFTIPMDQGGGNDT